MLILLILLNEVFDEIKFVVDFIFLLEFYVIEF